MNFVCLVFELGDKTLTLSPMENLMVKCNLILFSQKLIKRTCMTLRLQGLDVTFLLLGIYYPRAIHSSNLIMPVPRNMETYLNRKYYMENPCLSKTWDHKKDLEPTKEPIRIPCEKLFGIYPFVYRSKKPGLFPYEELRLGDKVLYRLESIIRPVY